MNNLDEIYRQKYLKYKAKYLDLKEQQGGVTYLNGLYVFFFPGDLEKIKTLGNNEHTNVLKQYFDTFTNSIGKEAFYYKINDKPPTDTIKLKRNLSTLEIKSANLARGAAFAAINIAKSSCKQAEPYYSCGKIDTFNDPNEIDIEVAHYVGKAKMRSKKFIDKTNPIIEILNEKYKKKYVAVLFNVGVGIKLVTVILHSNPKLEIENDEEET